MTRARADDWSILRSLAFLAATFAVMVGSLLPFGALAATAPGQPIVICSAQGPQTVQSGGLDGPLTDQVGAQCAACVLPLLAALPAPPAPEAATVMAPGKASLPAPARLAALPPALSPPRPPSTAPPHA